MRTVAPRTDLYLSTSFGAASIYSRRDWLTSPATSPPCRYTFKPTIVMRVIPFAVALEPSVVPVALTSCRNATLVVLVRAQRLLVDSKVCPAIYSPMGVT